MDCRQAEVECVVDLEEVVQIAEAITAAGGTVAERRGRPGRLDVLVVAGVDVAEPVRANEGGRGRVAPEDVQPAVAGVAGGHGAVEQLVAQPHAGGDAGRVADAEGMHQMLNDFRGDNALKELAADRHINHYKKKQVVYSEGNHPNRLYYIQKGKVKTFKTNDTGKELTVGLYNEGDFFGYTALLEETVYKETAEAIEDCDIAIVPKEEFENLLHSNKEVTHKFIKMLAKNISEKENQLLGLAYNSLRKRVADALLTLQSKYQKENQERFSMHISREDLANIAGTATESLIRTLSDFKSEKLIEISEGNIIITNQKKLAAMLN